MAGALSPHIQLLLRPWGAGTIVVIAVAGLCVNDLCLPHQSLEKPHADMASAHDCCQPGWQEKRRPGTQRSDLARLFYGIACCVSAYGLMVCKA